MPILRIPFSTVNSIFLPLGIPKFKTGFSSVPTLSTVADWSGSNVVTVPIWIFGVIPISPLGPRSPIKSPFCNFCSISVFNAIIDS